MLVLSRHRDQSIQIGDDVTITIVDIRGDKVRLGIDAPQDVPVHRQEVYEAIKRESHKYPTPTVPPIEQLEEKLKTASDLITKLEFAEVGTLVQESLELVRQLKK